jgi:plastocyanin
MDRKPVLGTLLVMMALLPLTASYAAAAISGRVVGPDGKGIAQAVVFVNDPGAPAASASGSTAEMDQINKTFVPGVLPVVVGTSVEFPNHDQIHHHVYSFSRTKTFELPLYKGEHAPPVVFDKVGVVKVACNIHDWMSGVILVLPTTHFAKTDADGRFTLAGVPAGAHTLAAWHEQNRGKLEENMQRIEVSDAAVEVNFTLTLAAARSRPAVSGARRDP